METRSQKRARVTITEPRSFIDEFNNDLWEMVGKAVELKRASVECTDYRKARNTAAFTFACEHLGSAHVRDILHAIHDHRRTMDEEHCVLADPEDEVYSLQPVNLFSYLQSFDIERERHGVLRDCVCNYFDSMYAIFRYDTVDGFGDFWGDLQSEEPPWLEGIIELIMWRKNCCDCTGACPARANGVIKNEIEWIGLTDSKLQLDIDEDTIWNPCNPISQHGSQHVRMLQFATSGIRYRHQQILCSLSCTVAWRSKLYAELLLAAPMHVGSGLYATDIAAHMFDDARPLNPEPDLACYPRTLMDIGRYMLRNDDAVRPWLRRWNHMHEVSPMRFTF